MSSDDVSAMDTDGSSRDADGAGAGAGETRVSLRDDLRRLRPNQRFRLLFAARFISNVGNGMAPIALAFGVLGLPGGDATDLSYVTTSQMVPIVAFLLLGGVLADRTSRSRLVGGSDVVGAVVVAANAVLFLTGQASVLLLCVTGAVIGVLNALWYPAFAGLMPEVVPADRLQSANSLVGFASNVGFTLGASAASVVVSTAGPGWAILLDAASFLVAGILVWQLRTPPVASDPLDRSGSTWRQLRDGWREFRSRTWLVAVVSAFAIANMCLDGFIGVLAPLQMSEEFDGARDMGLMMAGWGAGSVVGVAVSMRLRVHHPMRLAMSVVPLIGVWMLATAAAAPLVLLVPIAFASGIALDVFVVMWMTTTQRHVPAEALSRVGSFEAFGVTLLVPLGLLVAGPTAALLGTEQTLVIIGTATIVTCLAALASRSVRSLT